MPKQVFKVGPLQTSKEALEEEENRYVAKKVAIEFEWYVGIVLLVGLFALFILSGCAPKPPAYFPQKINTDYRA